jgi:hypothetical protein
VQPLEVTFTVKDNEMARFPRWDKYGNAIFGTQAHTRNIQHVHHSGRLLPVESFNGFFDFRQFHEPLFPFELFLTLAASEK